jgi:hypothetical protein
LPSLPKADNLPPVQTLTTPKFEKIVELPEITPAYFPQPKAEKPALIKPLNFNQPDLKPATAPAFNKPVAIEPHLVSANGKFYSLPNLKPVSLVDTYMQKLKTDLAASHIKNLKTAKVEWQKTYKELLSLSRNVQGIVESDVPIEISDVNSALIKTKIELDRKTEELRSLFGEQIVSQLLNEKIVLPNLGREEPALPQPYNPQPPRDVTLPVKPLKLPVPIIVPEAIPAAKRDGFTQGLKDMFKMNVFAMPIEQAPTVKLAAEAESADTLRLHGRSNFSGEHAGGVK